jgi:hypothetical protein
VTPVPPPFAAVEHLLQGGDGQGLGVGRLAQTGREQAVGGLAGWLAERGQAGAGPGFWPVLQPAAGLVVVERQRGEGALLVGQQAEQSGRGPAHLAGEGVVGQRIGRHATGIASRARIAHLRIRLAAGRLRHIEQTYEKLLESDLGLL